MTGIEGIGWPAEPRVTTRTTGRTGFVVPTTTTGASQASTVAAPQAAGLTSMLTLQELCGESVHDREARRHGQDMLAVLAELQRALLGGGDMAALQRLADLAATVPRATDRRLAAMISAIMVRVRVELARRER